MGNLEIKIECKYNDRLAGIKHTISEDVLSLLTNRDMQPFLKQVFDSASAKVTKELIEVLNK